MDIYKLKWTRLQNEIFRLLCIKVGTTLNLRGIARLLKVSPTAVKKSLKELEKEKLIIIEKNPTMNLTLVMLNRDNLEAINLKRVENLKMIYESGIVDFLGEKFPSSVIILFGSYSRGEDIDKSDIDIAIIEAKEKEINLDKFNKLLEREIRLNFYDSLNEIHKNLRESILNGILLSGSVSL